MAERCGTCLIHVDLVPFENIVVYFRIIREEPPYHLFVGVINLGYFQACEAVFLIPSQSGIDPAISSAALLLSFNGLNRFLPGVIRFHLCVSQ